MRLIIRRKQKRAAAVAAAALLAALGGALCLTAARPGEDVVYFGDYALRPGAPYAREEAVTLPSDALTPGALSLIDSAHPLASQTPGARDVRMMTGQYLPAREGVTLMPEAIYALCDMRADRSLDGMEIIAGTTSFAEQTALQREAYLRYAQVYAPADSVAMAQRYVPGAGESEHQSGWAFDIALTGTLEMGRADRLLQSEFGEWLDETMWRYGLIERYPAEKAAHFQGGCENLHLRYVGREHALAMRALNLCLEEYVAFLRARGSLTIERAGERWALILYLPSDGARTLRIPRGAAVLSASGDNAGGAVVVVR